MGAWELWGGTEVTYRQLVVQGVNVVLRNLEYIL